MNVSTYLVAPHTHLGRHAELVSALDALFREYSVPPGIVQHSFVDRRPGTRYAEILTILTPFPTVPSSELMEDIGRAVAPAQARIVGLQSSYHPPVFPPLPVAGYAPNEDEFVVARSQLLASVPNTWASATAEFETRFKSRLVLSSKEAGQVNSTLSALFTTKTNPDKPGHTTLVISCPALTLHSTASFSDRHAYTLHSLSASTGSSGPLTFTPKYAPARDQRFDRMCNGLRSECTWHWEVLDDQLRARGVRESETSNERIVVDVPPHTLSPLSITFSATLTATAGLDAIGRVHRTCWAPSAMQELQCAFDRTHPAVQVMHHVIRINIPSVGEMISDVADKASATLRGEVYAHGVRHYSGGLRIALDQDAGVLGRRGDEDEDDNSDEDE
ncbi:hypothetical protein RhiJN_02259 [Ceratobasidium sp. AG-Ba]|nr:hypothetical protein RhiJN_02259 [Ceratobasidium sp. AG-Ba]QRW03197.1 hypothetical protein RhiLY_02196 [Ceratobasidium sp. AG-Ba]